MGVLKDAFDRKAQEFAGFIKIGRTQLQDAVPMTLGQEFRTFVVMLGEDQARLIESAALLHEINLGATAIGTGLNAPRGYAALACQHLAELTGRPLVTAADLIEATQDPGAFVHLSGVLKRVAVKLSKTCNDLRLLSSGPRAGIGEITLPSVQAGSSIMPGKINPVIPEVVNQVAYAVIGNDITITMAAEAGQLQLNAFEPIIVRALSQSISQLSAACRTLAERCVDGIVANPAIMAQRVEESIGLATALNPLIGYYAATEVAKEALASGRTVPQVVLERGYLTDAQLQQALSPRHLANLPAVTAGEADLRQ
ncbi:Aspartate ammonia-lyase [compost metagenome]